MMNKLKLFSKIFLAIFLMVVGGYIYHIFDKKMSNDSEMVYGSELIQQQLKNVSKLVVNEATFSQILNYSDSKNYLMNLISFEKKALIAVNADVQILYDLNQLKYQIDEENKVVQITYIPKEETKINPSLKIYDIESSRFNTFKGEDYNKIAEKVKQDLKKKIENSELQKNAQNRLLSELSKFLIVTKSLGWTLEYKNNKINHQEDFIPMLKN